MDLIDQLKALSSKVLKQKDLIQTEEATKNAFVMPFIAALGYNVFDPTEVTPELSADVGVKKGEKVDYAILKDNKPIILFECKWCGSSLDQEHFSQLCRYFTNTEARFGILTNGIAYRFYTDSEEPNKMDNKPFLEVNMLDIKESLVDDLKKFTKAAFNLEETLNSAIELRYMKEIKQVLSDELNNPSESLVKFFTSKVYTGRLSQAVKQQFTDLTKKALNQFIHERINERLKSALSSEETAQTIPASIQQPIVQEIVSETPENKIVTTQEEWEGFYIVKAILRKTIDVSRVVMKDTIGYCGILLDGNVRKPICRLYFNNTNKKSLALFDVDKKEDKVAIAELNDMYHYAERIQNTISLYDQQAK
ncbi:MAG: hypothetical protein RIT27_1880 [Pseudomonadota bacterium]|jgi:hypothetical protein